MSIFFLKSGHNSDFLMSFGNKLLAYVESMSSVTVTYNSLAHILTTFGGTLSKHVALFPFGVLIILCTLFEVTIVNLNML